MQKENNLTEFNELMQEVAELGEQEATVVSYFAQGVIAQARASRNNAKEDERKAALA